MKALVIYHSKYGSCEKIAQSIQKGLADSGVDARIATAAAAPKPGADTDLVVVGSPTRASRAAKPIRKFIDEIDPAAAPNARYAAFGTGLAKWLLKGEDMASEFIYNALKYKGLKMLGKPFRAGVAGWKGPLTEGDTDKAYEFGKELASGLSVPA